MFNQAFEFIPDDAAWAVIDNEDDVPKLMAVSGAKLYTLTVTSELTDELITATTSCHAATLDPLAATVECETKFVGHRTNDHPMGRETTWTFRLGEDSLSFSTMVRPEADGLPKEEEFALALASALGWSQLPTPSTEPLIARR